MSLVVPVGFGEATFIYSLSGDPERMTTSLGFRSTGGTTEADLATAGADLVLAWGDNWHPTAADLNDQWTWVGAFLRINASDTGEKEVETNVNLVGTNVDATTDPQNIAILIKKLSGFSGRKNRGRMFVPPFSLGQNATSPTGMLDPAFVAGTQVVADALVAPDTCQTVILHTSALDDPVDIATLVVENQIATQRRRLRR